MYIYTHVYEYIRIYYGAHELSIMFERMMLLSKHDLLFRRMLKAFHEEYHLRILSGQFLLIFIIPF